MLAPGVIVCERRGRFAARIRHGLAEQGLHVRVSETRNGKDCLAAVRSRRSSAAVIEVTGNPVAALELIDEIRRCDCSVLVTVVVNRRSQWIEPLVREFGAAYCALDSFEINLLVGLIGRHLGGACRNVARSAVVEVASGHLGESECL